MRYDTLAPGLLLFVHARLTLFVAIAIFLPGCGARPLPSVRKDHPLPIAFRRASGAEPRTTIRLVSVAKQAGIDFAPGNGNRSPLTVLETAGGGCAFLDYDGDGWPDILLVAPHRLALYHNLHNGRFADVTAASGMTTDRYWMGCAVGDYDGDGRPDIFLTGYHCFALYHNVGNGKFVDVTRESGISGLDWSMSAAFADLDGDGRLDLFVTQYLQFDSTSQQLCQVGNIKSTCGPEVYKPLSGKLFRNLGWVGGHATRDAPPHVRFQAVPWHDTGKTWGAVASDLLDTGKPCLYLANDMMPGDLWSNDGRNWLNRGSETGTAYDGQGHLQGGMGVDSGDYDNDGRLDLVVTTYFAQAISLYHNDGEGLFSYTSSTSGLGPPSTPYVKFGVAFVDLDNDGWLDLAVSNGHVRDNVHEIDTAQSYPQPIQIFQNYLSQNHLSQNYLSQNHLSPHDLSQNHDRRFADVTAQTGGLFKEPIVGRGLSVADFNRDGREDILICNLEGRAVLLENRSETSPKRHWLNVQLRTGGANRFGVGAKVRLVSGGETQLREIKTSGSVLSALYPSAHFGLGESGGPVKVTVFWPSEAGKSAYSPTEVEIAALNTTVTISRERGLPRSATFRVQGR